MPNPGLLHGAPGAYELSYESTLLSPCAQYNAVIWLGGEDEDFNDQIRALDPGNIYPLQGRGDFGLRFYTNDLERAKEVFHAAQDIVKANGKDLQGKRIEETQVCPTCGAEKQVQVHPDAI